jgi:hypothetical protein
MRDRSGGGGEARREIQSAVSAALPATLVLKGYDFQSYLVDWILYSHGLSCSH